MLLVGDTVYVLDGHRGELDKFAGGPATVTGRVSARDQVRKYDTIEFCRAEAANAALTIDTALLKDDVL